MEIVKNIDGNGFHRIIGQAGWNLFYITGAIETSVFGTNKKRTTQKAIKQVIAKLGTKNFNCLEITRMTTKRFLGLPYLSVSAHSRHFEKSLFIF
jgi:hypothetical protein